MSMTLEVVTMIADALSDPTHGVNAQIASVPRLTGDTTVPPAIAFIGDEFRDDRVINRLAPPDIPAIYVMRDGPLVLHGEVSTTYRDTKVPCSVVCRIFTPFHQDAYDNRYNEYYGRAVMRSLGYLMDNQQSPLRDRGQTQLLYCEEMLWAPLREDVAGVIITGAVGLTVYCRDNAPIGG